MSLQEPIGARVALELRLGEMASLLADVAEALTYYPGELVVVDNNDASVTKYDGLPIKAEEWPSLQEITKLIDAWCALAKETGVEVAGRDSLPT